MTFSIDNPEGGCNNPPLGKYVWGKPSGEQGLSKYQIFIKLPQISHIHKKCNFSKHNWRLIDQLLLPYKFYGSTI